jgi:putative ABC transport system permease protein
MLLNYLKIAIRNIQRQKGFSFINITGLSIGLAIFILIALYVQFEFSFDKFQNNYDRIHRVELDFDGKGKQLVAPTHNLMGPTLVKEYPEIVESVRFWSMGGSQNLSLGFDKQFQEDNGWWAESNFLDFFTYKLISGDSKSSLKEPFSIVISEEMANKLFPKENALGKVVQLNNKYDCKVTGIIENCPANSHIQYNFLVSFSSYNTITGTNYLDIWDRIGTYTYVLLAKNTNLEPTNQKIRDILRKNIREDYPSHVYLKHISQFHFHSSVIGEIGPRGDLNKIGIFSAIGLFIIIIACINFMNLTTARSTKRYREIGIRKVLGARKISLIRQFLGESIFFALISLVFAMVLAEFLLPEFEKIIQRELSFNYLDNYLLIFGIFGITLLVGLLSGSYPALFLSSFKPANVLKAKSAIDLKSRLFRRTLVVFQFVISIVLIIGTLTIIKQTNFMKNKNLGFEKEHILVHELKEMDITTLEKYKTLKSNLTKIPDVKNVSISRFVPSFNGASSVFSNWEGSQEGDQIYANMNHVDRDFFKTYGMKIIEGREFINEEYRDSTDVCILNETAVKKAGWDNAVGKRFTDNYRVIGVVKDFHFSSLKNDIGAMILLPINNPAPGARVRYQLSAKLNPINIEKTVASVEKEYKNIFPNDQFGYDFFDEHLNWIYQNEQRASKTIGYFSVLAIFIACLGLFGLASFMTEQRVKEIGIRKILGANLSSIINLLSQEYTKLILLANLVACPIAYLVMNKWLQNFAYHTNVGIQIFLISAVSSFIITIATVSFQGVKAAIANPVKSLRYE